jgi:hypothetical protein
MCEGRLGGSLQNRNVNRGRNSRRCRKRQRGAAAIPSLDLSRGTHGPPLLKTFAAEHGPTLRRAERNRSFLPALRAGCFSFRPLKIVGAGTRALRALGFAILAPLGLVFEALVGEEHLFAGGEDKFLIALCTLQDLIVIFHTLLQSSTLVGEPAAPAKASDCAGIRRGRTWVPSPTAPRVHRKIAGRVACLGELSPAPAAASCAAVCAIELVSLGAFHQASCNNCVS